MMHQERLELFEGQIRRDIGIQQVLDHNREWKQQYRHLVENWFHAIPVGTEFTGEQMRMYAVHNGLGHPHHPNGWGGAANAMLRSWLKGDRIQICGLSQSQYVQAHARTCKVYRKTR